MIIDMHTHSSPWSVDGVQTVPELIEELEHRGVDGAALTDHFDFNSVSEDGRRWIFNINEYYQENKRFCKYPSMLTSSDKPGILLGIEISFSRNHVLQTQEIINNEQLDTIILSVHDYKGIDPVVDAKDLCIGKISDIYRKIIDEIAFSMSIFPKANVCGHYDFFSRYIPINNPKMYYKYAPESFDNLFSILIRNQQALEINTGTIAAFVNNLGMPVETSMPDPEIISRYREMGGNIITIASDAHCTKDCARYFPETMHWLKLQGIDKLSWMEKREWHWYSI